VGALVRPIAGSGVSDSSRQGHTIKAGRRLAGVLSAEAQATLAVLDAESSETLNEAERTVTSLVEHTLGSDLAALTRDVFTAATTSLDVVKTVHGINAHKLVQKATQEALKAAAREAVRRDHDEDKTHRNHD
jgi:hypothetical protein